MPDRAAGVLLHPTSLPTSPGVGDLGSSAHRFLDWLTASRCALWQILPLGPPGHGDSPYDGRSVFAGNPLLISGEPLIARGLLTAEDVEGSSRQQAAVDFAAVGDWKNRWLRAAFAQLWANDDHPYRSEFRTWCAATPQRGWLEDWALFAALRECHDRRPWFTWPPLLRDRDTTALAEARHDLEFEVDFHRFQQFLFFEQWTRLRSEATNRGIEIIGDIPFYVALDSADVWTHRDLFELQPDGEPRKVGGVPPDYFSDTGQRWGNPVYRWQRHEETHFDWWVRRLRQQSAMVDRLRLDHFRGFTAVWEVESSEPTAMHGAWRQVPGEALLDTVYRAIPGISLIAEDLGVITPEVEQLRDKFAMPGMKVLQFGFGTVDSEHLPHRLTSRVVLYTGTHDNDTIAGWLSHADERVRQRVLDYAGADPDTGTWNLIRIAMTSVAELVIVPIQDIAGLGSEHRMNIPGAAEGNWGWRVPESTLTSQLAADLGRLIELSGRARSRSDSAGSH